MRLIKTLIAGSLLLCYSIAGFAQFDTDVAGGGNDASTTDHARYLDPENFIRQHSLAHTTSYAKSLCDVSGFHCIKVRRGKTWYQLWPNFHQREIVMRLNRINVSLIYRNWLVVPNSFKNLDYMDLAPFPKYIDPPGERELLIDLGHYEELKVQPEKVPWVFICASVLPCTLPSAPAPKALFLPLV